MNQKNQTNHQKIIKIRSDIHKPFQMKYLDELLKYIF